MFSLLVASPVIERRSSLPRTSCAMRLVTRITMRNARVLLLDNNHSAAHVQAGRTIRRGALVSSIVLCQPGASRRTLWGWRISSIRPTLFKWKRWGDRVEASTCEPSVGYTSQLRILPLPNHHLNPKFHIVRHPSIHCCSTVFKQKTFWGCCPRRKQ